MVVSGSVLGPEPAGWPIKELNVNRSAAKRMKTREEVEEYVTSQKPTKIEYDVWNPFNTVGVGLTEDNESLYSLSKAERLETLRLLGIPLPANLSPGTEDVYIANVLRDYGVEGGLKAWVKMSAAERKQAIEKANRRPTSERLAQRGVLSTPPVDDPFNWTQGYTQLGQDILDAINNLQPGQQVPAPPRPPPGGQPPAPPPPPPQGPPPGNPLGFPPPFFAPANGFVFGGNGGGGGGGGRGGGAIPVAFAPQPPAMFAPAHGPAAAPPGAGAGAGVNAGAPRLAGINKFKGMK